MRDEIKDILDERRLKMAKEDEIDRKSKESIILVKANRKRHRKYIMIAARLSVAEHEKLARLKNNVFKVPSMNYTIRRLIQDAKE